MIAAMKPRDKALVQVGQLEGTVFVGIDETEFTRLVAEQVADSLPGKLSYTIRMETIREIVKSTLTDAVEAVLAKIKSESRRV